jgi:hypothetical protein
VGVCLGYYSTFSYNPRHLEVKGGGGGGDNMDATHIGCNFGHKFHFVNQTSKVKGTRGNELLVRTQPVSIERGRGVAHCVRRMMGGENTAIHLTRDFIEIISSHRV